MHKIKKQLTALVLVLLVCMGMVPVRALDAPVAENLELSTYRGVSVGGHLSAAAAEGSKLSYQITTQPSKGSITLEEDGHFIYTPEEGRRGRDYFGYKAIDQDGNASQEATVIIHLLKCKTTFRYADTQGLACDYAAHVLAAEGLLQGQCIAGSYVFEPNRTISRGEFITLALECAGLSPLSNVKSTGCRDDAEIEAWLKPYVSTALFLGCAETYPREDTAVFDPDSLLTLRQACTLVNGIFSLTNVPCMASADDYSIQAITNLEVCGILPGSRRGMDEALTRGEAAMLLQRTMEAVKGQS